jgi:hypothetical protein
MLWLIIGAGICFAAAPRLLAQDQETFEKTASISGNTGFWKVLTAVTLHPGQTAFSAWYDRINRNPGFLTISTSGFSAAAGIGHHLEVAASFEANRRILVRRADQLSFGQQAMGLFGNQTPGSPPLPEETVPGSSRMPQLRSPAAPAGMLTGAAGYYNLLPFAGLARESGGVGQVTIGVKWNVFHPRNGLPIDLAVRAHFDIPIRKGIDYLLIHPTGTADLQYGFDGIVSRSIGELAELHFNAGYRHINQPVHVSVVKLADEAPFGVALNLPRSSRVQFVGEATAEIFIGSHTPNTTFGAEDPVDLTLGFRAVFSQMSLLAGYRRPINQYGGDKNGFVVMAGFTSARR